MRTPLLILLSMVVTASAQRALAVELFWNDDDGIHNFDRTGRASAPVLFETYQTRGIAVDASRDRLLWSDVLPILAPIPGGVIRSGGMQGGDVTTIVNSLPGPSGMAVDSRRGKVYWTDLGNTNNSSAIFAADLDGSNPQRLISGIWLSEIAGIALDLHHEKMYFTYVNPLLDSLYNGGIARANLDGSNIEPIVSGLGKPIGIAVDSAGGGIYWADARRLSPGGGDGRIQATNLDGTAPPRTIFGGLDLPYGVALDLAKRDVYWTDMGTGMIQRTIMSGILPFFENVVVDLKNPTAIAITPELLPGDANGDGRVDRMDLVIVSENFGRWGANVNWSTGDFDNDRRVGLSDAGIIQFQLGGAAVNTTAVAPVPEPATALAGLVASAILLIAGNIRHPRIHDKRCP